MAIEVYQYILPRERPDLPKESHIAANVGGIIGRSKEGMSNPLWKCKTEGK